MKVIKHITIITAAMLMSAFALSGCAVGEGLNIAGFTVGDSHHTTDADRQNTFILQDIDGNVYSNALYIAPIDNLELDNESLRNQLTDAGVNWYQMIATSRMSTGGAEKAYLFLPASGTYTDLINTQAFVQGLGYECNLLTPDEYQSYVDNVNPNDLYTNETTYFGPAAVEKETK